MRPSRLALVGLAAALTALPAVARAQSEEGHWTITPLRKSHALIRPGSVQLTLMTEPDNMSSLTIALARLRGLTQSALDGAPATTRFQITSDAGTVSFTGHVGDGTGSGRFDFAPNRAFGEQLRRRGVIGDVSDHDLYRLTLHGVSSASLDAVLATLRKYDFELPTTGELVRFTTHDIDERVIQDLGDAGMRGLSPESIVRLVNHDIDGQFVREWRDVGYRDLTAEDLVRLRNHGVSASWARQENERSGGRLGVEGLVRLRRGR